MNVDRTLPARSLLFSILRSKRGDASHASGFTLVELLVVIAIIGVLSGLLVPTIGIARRKSRVNNTQSDINTLKVSIELYQGRNGDYPPTELEVVYEGETGNGINDGIESLLAFLTSKKGGPACFEPQEDLLSNLDEDQLKLNDTKSELDWLFGDRQLREYVDHFGNPYVYVHNADYHRTYRVQTEEGETVSVRCQVSSKTQAHHSPQSYQIWSFGVDGINQNGVNGDEVEGDDINSW